MDGWHAWMTCMMDRWHAWMACMDDMHDGWMACMDDILENYFSKIHFWSFITPKTQHLLILSKYTRGILGKFLCAEPQILSKIISKVCEILCGNVGCGNVSCDNKKYTPNKGGGLRRRRPCVGSFVGDVFFVVT